MFAHLPSPSHLVNLYGSARSRDADMNSGSSGNVLTGHVAHTCLACTVTEPLSIAHEEINCVLTSLLSVRHPVLTKHARWLHEQIACFRSLDRFGKLLR